MVPSDLSGEAGLARMTALCPCIAAVSLSANQNTQHIGKHLTSLIIPSSLPLQNRSAWLKILCLFYFTFFHHQLEQLRNL